jgi:hypothetical protein
MSRARGRTVAIGAGAACLALTDLDTVVRLLAPNAASSLASLLAIHTGCAIAAGALLAGAAPPFVRHTPLQVGTFATCIAFFVPVFGLLGVLGILMGGLAEARPVSCEPWLVHDGPGELDDPRWRGARGLRRRASAEEIGQLLRRRAPESAGDRFRAVLATRHLPALLAVPLLKVAQSDPSDEVRLYAFSRLESMRDEIEKRIDRLGTALATAEKEDEPRLQLRLAESYWELGWTGLADGAVLEHALACAHRHARAACELAPANAAAEFFLGRVLVQLRDATTAKTTFEAAERSGYPRRKVLPRLAECAFLQRDFRAVRVLLSELEASSQESADFDSVIELWTRGTEPARLEQTP